MKDVDIVCFSYDFTPYIVGNNIDQITSALQNTAASLFKWFSNNQMKVNPDKFHLLNDESRKKEINISCIYTETIFFCYAIKSPATGFS